MTSTASVEENKELVRRLYEEGINEWDEDLFLELYASDCVIHGVLDAEGGISGQEALEQYLTGIRDTFPDMTATIESMIAEDDLVAVRTTYTATHEGEYMGVPATGKTASWDGMIQFRIEDGEIAEAWPLIDDLGLMRRLGAIEIPGE